MLIVKTTITAPGWDAATDWSALGERAARAALMTTPHAGLDRAGYAVEVAVRLSDDAEIQGLNRQYRHKDVPTNVLSFPMVQPDLLGSIANSDDGEVLLGDIVLAAQTVAAEAAAKGLSVADHATHLIVHGLLHLIGYDHGDDGKAEAMEALETTAMATLGLADPYQ